MKQIAVSYKKINILYKALGRLTMKKERRHKFLISGMKQGMSLKTWKT